MRPCPFAVALALAAAAAASASPESPPTLLMTSTNDGARVFLGAPSRDAAPEVDEGLLRTSSGAWTRPSPLPWPRQGLPLVHRATTWFLETQADARGGRYHVLLPLSGERAVDGVRIEAAVGATSEVVVTLDDWTFAIGEIDAEGGVLVREITSHGTPLEMDVAREWRWRAGWPAGSRLLATGTMGARVAVTGLTPDGSAVASVFDGTSSRAIPPLSVGSRRVAASITAAGPVVALLGPEGLAAHAWAEDRWTDLPPLSLPAGSVAALAAATLGKDRGSVLVVVRDAAPAALAAVVVTPGGWGPIERVPLEDSPPTPTMLRPAGTEAAAAPGLLGAEAAQGQARLGRIRLAVLGGGLVVVTVLLWRLATGARRR